MKGDRTGDAGLLVLRIGLGLILLYFGSQKALGVFGGQGYGATVAMFHTKMGIPVIFGHLSIAAEFLGSLAVLVGLLTRIAAFGVAINMAVATFFNSKTPGLLSGMFSGSGGADASKLYFSMSLCIMAIVIVIMGPGAFSLDNKLFRKGKR